MSLMTAYGWNSRILHEVKLESKPKFEQKIKTAAESVFLVQILRDLSNLKNQIKKERI
jgi:hypothetical protein